MDSGHQTHRNASRDIGGDSLIIRRRLSVLCMRRFLHPLLLTDAGRSSVSPRRRFLSSRRYHRRNSATDDDGDPAQFVYAIDGSAVVPGTALPGGAIRQTCFAGAVASEFATLRPYLLPILPPRPRRLWANVCDALLKPCSPVASPRAAFPLSSRTCSRSSSRDSGTSTYSQSAMQTPRIASPG